MPPPPSNIVFERLDNPTEATVIEAAKLFADLMSADPAAIAVTGGDISLIPLLGRVMLRPLLLCPGVGQTFIARDEHGALVGYAAFTLSGQVLLSTPEQQAYGLGEFMEKLSPEGKKYYEDTLGTEVPKAHDECLGIKDAERNTYWCDFAMVRADFQGRGIATALFQLAFEAAKNTGVTVALGTTNARNVAIYKAIGLEARGKREFTSPWVDWTLWHFARESGEEARREN